MIAISEKEIDISLIKIKHIEFVEKYANSVIAFYVAIFNLLSNIDGRKGVTDRYILKEIEKIKDATGCGNYKLLLQALVKKNVRIKSFGDVVLIKKDKNRIFSRDGIKKAKGLLQAFLIDYKIFLSIELHDNLPETHLKYRTLCFKYNLMIPLINQIFDYENWFLKLLPTAEWGPYQLARDLQLNTCPYCNRQYTFTVVNLDGKKISRPSLDHFLPKSKHPFLALSFYNLIPACTICNSGLKRDVDITYDGFLNPYEENEKHSLMRFTYFPKDYESSIGLNRQIKIEVKYAGDHSNNLLKNKVLGNVALFSLNELYDNHRDQVQEIIWKRHHANDQYISILQKTFKNFDLSIEDAYRYAYGNYYHEIDFYKRTLSKLTKDIAIELGCIEEYK